MGRVGRVGRSLGRAVGGSRRPGVDPGADSLGGGPEVGSPAVGNSVGGRPGEDIPGVEDLPSEEEGRLGGLDPFITNSPSCSAVTYHSVEIDKRIMRWKWNGMGRLLGGD